MRLGDLDKLKEDFDCVGFNDYDDYNRALRIIDNAPTVEERPQGEWIFHTTHWTCSVCNETAKTIGYCGTEKFMYGFFRFCPNCGAEMRGNKNENKIL